MSEFSLVEVLGLLSNIVGTAGSETAVRRAIRPFVEDYVDELYVDAMGNLVTLKRGTGESALRVLVTAHMDEVGLMVTGYRSDGELRVETIGGINARLLPGLHVVVGQDQLPGVIGVKPIHHAYGNSAKAASVRNLAVDIGAKNKDEAEGLAPLGTFIAFNTKFCDLGSSLMGKAFDDRAGCSMLMALLRDKALPFDLHGVFTVQEEVGLRGAQVAAYAVAPDVAIVLEGTLADDMPKKSPDLDVSPTTELGKGPALTVKDRSYITPPQLLAHFVKTAESENIPYQLKQPGISGTEAGSIHKARGGILAITVAVPCRYIHSPVSLIRRRDLEHTFQLVHAALDRLTPESIGFLGA